MTARRWMLIAAGLALNAAVLVLPLTPFPVLQLALDRDYVDVQRGYDQFLRTGKWKVGDLGFDLVRAHYMVDVVRGVRAELDSRVMDGLRLDMFQVGKNEDDPNAGPEQCPVYVIFSNQQGHVVDAKSFKILTSSFRKPYANLASAFLLSLAAFLIYRGLAGPQNPASSSPNPGTSPSSGNSLLRNNAS